MQQNEIFLLRKIMNFVLLMHIVIKYLLKSQKWLCEPIKPSGKKIKENSNSVRYLIYSCFILKLQWYLDAVCSGSFIESNFWWLDPIFVALSRQRWAQGYREVFDSERKKVRWHYKPTHTINLCMCRCLSEDFWVVVALITEILLVDVNTQPEELYLIRWLAKNLEFHRDSFILQIWPAAIIVCFKTWTDENAKNMFFFASPNYFFNYF